MSDEAAVFFGTLIGLAALWFIVAVIRLCRGGSDEPYTPPAPLSRYQAMMRLAKRLRRAALYDSREVEP